MALLIGLEETREACCGLGPFKATVGCLSKEMACGAAERRHVWWDLYTPTEAVHALLANWSWGYSSWSTTTSSPPPAMMSSICRPISLQQLAAVVLN